MIDHSKLLKILSKEIKCQKTLALIKSSLKAGFVSLGGVAQKTITGTPQGSVFSPLLCNIYLHKLDLFMEKLSKELYKGSKRRQNPDYTRLVLAISKTKNRQEKKALRQELRKVRATNLMDPKFIRVQYVRFADDFLISVIGPHSLAEIIKEKVRTFL